MIDVKNGNVFPMDSSECLYPRMPLSDFQRSRLFATSRKNQTYNNRVNAQYVLGPLQFIGENVLFVLDFTHEALIGIMLFLSPHQFERGWFQEICHFFESTNELSAEETKEFCDRWLQQAIGQSCSEVTYPPWGEIRSVHDELRDGAWIEIEYW